MKKFFVLLLALTVLLTGCQKSEKIDYEFHDITLSTSWSNVIELEISEDNKIEQKLDYTILDNDGSIFQTDYWIKGTVTYEGQDYEFGQQF